MICKKTETAMPFDKIKAQRVKTFIENLTYSKGTWAGQPFRLLTWQWEDIISPLFGTISKIGLRQYRTCYVECPKKQGKSEIGAALALYMLCADAEGSPEVYGCAADREQASLIYHAAATMVRNSAILSKVCKVVDSRKRIIYQKNGGVYQVLSAESYNKHGISPSAILFDEIHAQTDSELWETMTAGTDYARSQQLVFAMTTAGIYRKESLWWRMRTHAQQVKAGIIKDPRFLPVLYVANPDDDPGDEELWKRVNPSLGQIFTLDKIRQDYNEAKNNPTDFQNFKRFRLNIPIRQLSKWMDMTKWDKCNGAVDMESLEGRRCYGGLDLSKTTDMTAFVIVFDPDEDGIADILCKFYCPEEGIMKRSSIDRVPYNIWEQEGFLIATPGETIDYTFVEKDISDLIRKYNIQDIGYDPNKAQSIYNTIMAEFNPTNDKGSFQMVSIAQGTKFMHEPSQNLLINIVNRKIRHGGNPILRWNMDNIVMRTNSYEEIRPDKGKAVERIDGGVALIMAWGRMMFSREDGEPNMSFL